MELKDKLQDLQTAIANWSNLTFGKHINAYAKVHGAVNAIDKLFNLYLNDHGKTKKVEQHADVLIFLLDAMSKEGITISDIIVAIDQRHQVNLKDKWESKDNGLTFTRVKPTNVTAGTISNTHANTTKK